MKYNKTKKISLFISAVILIVFSASFVSAGYTNFYYSCTETSFCLDSIIIDSEKPNSTITVTGYEALGGPPVATETITITSTPVTYGRDDHFTTFNNISCIQIISNDFFLLGEISYIDCCDLITLKYFQAFAGNQAVELAWETESEINNAGFNIYRSERINGRYCKVNDELIPATGGSTQGAFYSFVDQELMNRFVYYYKLEDIDFMGKSTFHGPVRAVPRRLYDIWQ